MYTGFRPNRSPKLPAPSTRPALVAMKATITHCTVCRSVLKSRVMEGRATFRAMSSDAKNIPKPAAAATMRSTVPLSLPAGDIFPGDPLQCISSGVATVTDCTPYFLKAMVTLWVQKPQRHRVSENLF